MKTAFSKVIVTVIVAFLFFTGCKKDDETSSGRIFINYYWQYFADMDTTMIRVDFRFDHSGGKEASILPACEVRFNNDLLTKDEWGYYRKIYTGLVTGDFVYKNEEGDTYTCALNPLKQFSIPDTFTAITRGVDNIFNWEGDTIFGHNELALSVLQTGVDNGQSFFLEQFAKKIVLPAERLRDFIPGTNNAVAILGWSHYEQLPMSAPAGATLHQVISGQTKTISIR